MQWLKLAKALSAACTAEQVESSMTPPPATQQGDGNSCFRLQDLLLPAAALRTYASRAQNELMRDSSSA
jgi:hypothetical protein